VTHAIGCGIGQPCPVCERRLRYGAIVRAIGPCPGVSPGDPPEIAELRGLQWDGLDALADLMRADAVAEGAGIERAVRAALLPPGPTRTIVVAHWPARIDLMRES